MIDTRSWELRLGYLTHDVSRLRRVCFDRELAPLGITRSQWWVLAFISRNDGLQQTQLANELDVGKVALGSLIDRLQVGGFVERRPDDKDRRVKRVFLTEKASSLISRIAKINDEFNARILKGIPREDLDLTSRTLFEMKRNLVALTNPEDTKSDAGDETDGNSAAPRVSAL